ncbi:MAG: SulP family inorganic anion transporter [Patescibacteria group bacterium]
MDTEKNVANEGKAGGFAASLPRLLKENWKSALSVALINIPLSISLAVASLGNGSDSAPLVGILTAVWAGSFAALFASSNFNVYGPAGALSGILLAFALEAGPQYVPFLAIATGLAVIVIWALKLSRYITLIPGAALHGFLLGVGITIAASQLNAALGIAPKVSHPTVVANFLQTLAQFGETNWAAFAVFATAFAFLQVWKKFVPSVPGPIPLTALAIALSFLLTKPLSDAGVQTIGTKFPTLAFQLFSIPDIPSKADFFANLEIYRLIGKTAAVIAVIAVLETMISAKIAAKMRKEDFDRDREIFGLGMANLASGIVGGLPATAVLVRTALNAKSGATHRTSAFLIAVFTTLIAWLCFSAFKLLPMPVVAAILVNIAIGMVEFELYAKIFKFDRTAFFLTFLVAAITVIDDPTMGILAGTAVSLIVFIKKVSDGNVKVSVFRKGEYFGKIRVKEYLRLQKPGDVLIYRFNGSVTYLNVEAQLERLREIREATHVVFSFSNVYNVDLDGFEALEAMMETVREKGIEISVSGLSKSLVEKLAETPFYAELKNEGRIYSASSLALKKLFAA